MTRWVRTAIGCAMVAAWMGLAGCDGDSGGGAGSGGDPKLVGQWRMTAMSVNGSGYFAPATIGWDVQMQLNGDGSARVTEVWQGSTESNSGGWSASGGQLTLDAGWYDWTGAYTAGGSQFTLVDVPNYDGEGDRGSFVFSRQ